MAAAERELEVLESIYHNGARVRQRDLARVAGLSLGMTNAILKRLAHKGWLVIRKVNNRNILYAVTPAGSDEIARRSYRYFKRTIKNVVDYKDAIERLVADAQAEGLRRGRPCRGERPRLYRGARLRQERRALPTRERGPGQPTAASV